MPPVFDPAVPVNGKNFLNHGFTRIYTEFNQSHAETQRRGEKIFDVEYYALRLGGSA
jgi:hypothetical protein